MSEFKVVEDNKDLLRDMHSKAIINTNRSAYEAAVNRVRNTQKQKDELRDATREINILKSEMHEIKSLLIKLVEKDGR
jgi:AMMECR1 domain-containing protein